MKRRIINISLVTSIVLFPISLAHAQNVQLDFQSPSVDSMTCEDNPNGTSCIEIDSASPQVSREVGPSATDIQALRETQAATSLPLVTDTQREAKCVSNGGSTSATSVGGFCVASDLRTSVTDFADFAVANDEVPVTGLQFLQVTMRDGSTLVGSREIVGADAPMGAVCASGGGSTAATEDTGGFCMASDLRSDSPAAAFSVANGLPVAGMHFLQITFSGTSQIGEPLFNVNAEDAKCVSVDGSTATSGNAGGFCMASDLGTSILGVANFSVANELPAVEMHFLQATFGASGTSEVFSQGADDAPMGVECVSHGGSTAATGDAQVSCLASDLSPQITGDANFSVANDLPIASMQFLQATFGDGIQPSQLDGTGGQDAECESVEGSTATAGDSEGVCMVSDRTISTTSFANFSVANGLPVAALHFFQVPLRDDNQLSSLGYLLGEGAPMGVAISDSPRPQLIRPSLPALAGISGHNNRYFRILGRRSGIEIQSGRNQSRGSRPVFWLSR